MKRLASLFAAGAIVCWLSSFAGAVSLINISWLAVTLLSIGGIVCLAGLAIFQPKA